jgi:uncharacterized protein YjbI with pentapeptide repeats
MTWLFIASLGLAVTIFIALAYRRRWRWTGFSEIRKDEAADDEVLQSAKTLWDWLQLLVIPLALAALAFLLNNSQSDREQRREDERAARQQATAADAAREEALRAYLTQMSELMLDRKLRRSRPFSNVGTVARTITLTTLRRVDGERKALIVRFLFEAELLDRPLPNVNLAQANLRSADLEGAPLVFAALGMTELRGADLRRANLFQVDLRRADLRGADLQRALLGGADLRRADLRGADFGRAEFREPLLTGPPDFRRATYDSATVWPDAFDPEVAGARKSR